MSRRLTRQFWLPVLVATFVVGAATARPSELPVEAAMSPVHAPVPRSLLLKFLTDKSTFTLIDARSPEEYAESHIDGAINVPHDRADEYGEGLPAALDTTLVIYCRTGKRAGRLQAQLAARGYSDVRVLGPEQIFASDGLMVFNCGAQPLRSPAELDAAAGAAREEETKR